MRGKYFYKKVFLRLYPACVFIIVSLWCCRWQYNTSATIWFWSFWIYFSFYTTHFRNTRSMQTQMQLKQPDLGASWYISVFIHHSSGIQDPCRRRCRCNNLILEPLNIFQFLYITVQEYQIEADADAGATTWFWSLLIYFSFYTTQWGKNYLVLPPFCTHCTWKSLYFSSPRWYVE